MKLRTRLQQADGGRMIAYAGQVTGLGLSLWANIRDAYIPSIPDGAEGRLWRVGYTYINKKGEQFTYKALTPELFDIVIAAFFPIGLFGALELLMRVRWQKKVTHWVARIGGVGLMLGVTGFTSYMHLRKSFLLSGQSEIVSNVAPFAIDGFLAMCALVLYITGPHNRFEPTDRATPTPPVRAALAPLVSHPVPALAHAALGPPEPPALSQWPSPVAPPASHPIYVPPSRPAQDPEAAPEPPTKTMPEPVAQTVVAQDETAAQNPSHRTEPPTRANPSEPPAQDGSPDQSEVAHAKSEPVAQAPDEPVAQVAQYRPEPPPVHPVGPPGSGGPETVEDGVAQAIRAIDANGLSERKAADKFGVSRGAIQRTRKAIAEGRATLPAAPADEVETEVKGLDDALERILAQGRNPEA